MSNSQAENKKKHRSLVYWLLVALVLLSLMVGGVSAYLSMSSGTVVNTLKNAAYPTVTVSGEDVVVDPKGYAVYLRAAVDACWQKDGSILPEEPQNAFDIADGWTLEDDGFYYYNAIVKVVPEEGKTTPESVTIPLFTSIETGTKDGYTLKVNVAAQVVQAVGYTDDDNKPAVEAAWGFVPQTTNQ